MKQFSSLFKKKVILIIIPVIVAMVWSAGLLLSSFDRFEAKPTGHGKFSCSCAVFYKKGSPEEFICYVKKGKDFNLIKELSNNRYNGMIVWGGCGGCYIKDFFYDEKYIEKIKNKYDKKKECGEAEIHRFKAIKKGYTEITINGTCHYDGIKYRMLIY